MWPRSMMSMPSPPTLPSLLFAICRRAAGTAPCGSQQCRTRHCSAQPWLFRRLGCWAEGFAALQHLEEALGLPFRRLAGIAAARVERGDGGGRLRGRHEAALQRQRQAGAAEHAEDREERNDSEYEGEIK